MTYGDLKNLSTSLLRGDTVLPPNNSDVLPLLDYAFYKVAMDADSTHLATDDTTSKLIRQSTDTYWIRKPYLPESDSEELDIDDDLGYAVTFYMCATISKNKALYFEREASKIVNEFNSKIQDSKDNVYYDKDTEGYIL